MNVKAPVSFFRMESTAPLYQTGPVMAGGEYDADTAGIHEYESLLEHGGSRNPAMECRKALW